MSVKRKLNVADFVFEIKNEDLINCYVTYDLGKVTITEFINGKKVKSEKDTIELELEGETKTGKTGYISMDLNVGLYYLNRLSNKPTEISKFITEIEASLNGDNTIYIDFNFLHNESSDIFKNHSSVWVSKVDYNVFFFKVCSQSGLFSYFKVDFN